MILTIVNVIYVLVAIAMIALILMQRGAGAAAGSGFGGGASATVFGARGSANFLSSATKWLAVVFFAMSLGMAWSASRGMRQAPAATEIDLPDAPAAASELPGLPESVEINESPAASEAPAAELEVPAEAPVETPAEASKEG